MEEHRESPLKFQSIAKWQSAKKHERKHQYSISISFFELLLQTIRILNMGNMVSSLAFTYEQSRHSCLAYDLRSKECLLASKSIPAGKLRWIGLPRDLSSWCLFPAPIFFQKKWNRFLKICHTLHNAMRVLVKPDSTRHLEWNCKGGVGEMDRIISIPRDRLCQVTSVERWLRGSLSFDSWLCHLILDKLFNLSGYQFPHLCNRDNDAYFIRSLQGLNEITLV